MLKFIKNLFNKKAKNVHIVSTEMAKLADGHGAEKVILSDGCIRQQTCTSITALFKKQKAWAEKLENDKYLDLSM